MKARSNLSRSLGIVLERYRLPLLVFILFVAAAFRFVGLDHVTPPGLEHDEVAHWLINQDILAGNHAIYFTDAYGHEALYHYLQAGFGALVGDHALALRLPSAYFGILLVAVSYTLGRRLFGNRAGLFSAAFLAVLFWPVFYSRLALRAISLPVFSGLSAYFWWRAGATSRAKTSLRLNLFWFALAGLFAGLSLHTYMAARAVPIFFALFTVYLAIFHWTDFRRYWPGIILFWIVLSLVGLPLVWFLVTNPGVEVRISEVDAPLRALRDGNFGPLLENSLRIAGMFAVRGDPLWRQNIAYQPVFGLVLGLLFYLGVGLAIWRWRDARHTFLLLWLATAAIPSLVTIDAPSSIRVINLLPVLMLLPVLVIHRGSQLSTLRDKFSTDLVTGVVVIALVILLGIQAWTTVFGLWRLWPAGEEVQFVWQAALTEAAAYLDRSPETSPVAIGGWTPDSMDPPTINLTLSRDDLSIRYFNPTESLILPDGGQGQPARMVRPAILPLAPMLEAVAGPHNSLPADALPGEQFALHTAMVIPDGRPMVPAAEDFGGEMRFIGYDWPEPCEADGSCLIATYWQVLVSPDGPRRFFLHRIDTAGSLIAQDDRLGAPAEHWQPGDLIIQLISVPPGEGALRLGVYNPGDGQRLETTGGDAIFLEIPPD
jgi:4-amino-4-deoxy-L-arabinose transferase-like glycosyltransferase